jgi:hypothetical protein
MRALLVTGATLTALVFAPDAAAITYSVHDERGFQRALNVAVPGDTIKLGNGTWARMAISHRNYGTGRQVSITASARTISRGFTLVNSSGIKFVSVAFNGNAGRVILGGAGNYGNNITVRSCSFTNADEFIHIHGGATWLVERNNFGQNNAGLAAVKFAPGSGLPQLRNITVQNNLFKARGFGRIGVGIKASPRSILLPYNVKIVNNTIITNKSGVALSDGWDAWPVSKHPIVANNAMSEFAAPFNTRGRLFSNVAERGAVVSGGDIGPLNLNADLSPSSSSKLIIDLADPLYAPDRDYNNARIGPPDRGAIEYLGKRRAGARVGRLSIEPARVGMLSPDGESI